MTKSVWHRHRGPCRARCSRGGVEALLPRAGFLKKKRFSIGKSVCLRHTSQGYWTQENETALLPPCYIQGLKVSAAAGPGRKPWFGQASLVATCGLAVVPRTTNSGFT
jgi:hypothetical protein